MAFEFHVFALPFMISAITSLLVAVLIFQRQNVKGGVALALLMLEFAVWSGANAVRLSLVNPDEQIPWLRLAHALLVPAPVTFLIFVAQLTDMDRWLTNTRLLALAAEPLLTVLIIALNDISHLYYAWFRLVVINGVPEVAWGRGPWFWLNMAFSNLFILAAVITLVRAMLRAGPFSRVQLMTVLIGCLLPWGVNAYSLLWPSTARRLELTPLAAVASGLIFAYALFRQRLLDIAPVARSLLFEKLGDAVLVVDTGGRIVDMNAAAQNLIHVQEDVYGRPLVQVVPQWRDFVEQLDAQAPDGPLEVQGRSDPSRFFDVSVTPLMDSRGNRSGTLIAARDVTERKRAELEAYKMNARLRRQVQKISKLHEELREQAIRDPVTGLYNRRYLDETLKREFSRARRAGYPVSLIMMDLDRFKRVNDTHGHKAGDRVLSVLGEIIREHVRNSDIPCRFGGEEFVIVMPETTLETAFQRAEQIRAQFRATRFFKEPGGAAPSLSMGVAAYPAHGRTEDKILHAADRAMYAAKALGGNKAVRYDGRQKTMPLPAGKERGQ